MIFMLFFLALYGLYFALPIGAAAGVIGWGLRRRYWSDSQENPTEDDAYESSWTDRHPAIPAIVVGTVLSFGTGTFLGSGAVIASIAVGIVVWSILRPSQS